MSKIYFTLRYSVIVFLMLLSVRSFGQSLACNGGVNISMDQNCEVVISSKHILKGPDSNADPEDFLLTIKKPDGSIPSEILVYDSVNDEFTDTLGNSGIFIKFINSGDYIVSVQRISDGTRCWGDLKIEDKLAPYTDDCPCSANDPTPDEDCIFSCASVNFVMDSDSITGLAGINPVFKDNCNNLGDISFFDVLSPDTSCGGWIITRTWRALVPDVHGTTVLKDLNCVQKFVFKSAGINSIVPPSNKVIVTCGIETDPESLREYFSNPNFFNNPNLDTAIVRSYPSIIDTIPGHGTILRRIGAGLTEPGTNDGLCKLTATYTDSPIIPHCEDIGYKFVRTWHVIDWCAVETLDPLTQIIKVMDHEAPKFTIGDTIPVSSTNPWTCDTDIIVPAPDTLFDNCASASQITWTASVTSGGVVYEANAANGYRLDGLGTGTYQVTYKVSDLCNNMDTASSTLVIKDLIKPVALAKYRVKVVFSSFQGECVAKIFAHNVNAGSFDACDDELDYAIRRKGDSLYANFVKFTDLDLDDVTPGGTPFGEVLIELRVTDDCGNSSIAWTTVVVEDKNTDVTKICGSTEINLDCTVDVDTAIVQNLPRVILNGCTNRDLPVTYNVRSRDLHDMCNTGRVVVDYFVEGSVDTFCTKIFTLGDVDSLRITWPPANLTVTCDETDFGDVMIQGGMCNEARPTESTREVTAPQGLGYCKKIIREITVIDWCNYQPNTGDTTGVYKFVQIIKVVDNVAPSIQCADQTLDAGALCSMSGIVVTASGSDSGVCADQLSWQAAVDTDNDGTFDLELVVSSAGDSSVSAVISEPLTIGTYNVRWRASDECGNSDEVVCSITLTDNEAPDPKCVTAVSTTTMGTDGTANIWAQDFDPMNNSTDQCGGTLTYSFSPTDPNVPNMMFTCDDIEDNISALLDLKVYVWDQSGNNSFCNVQLRIDDNSDACVDDNMTASALISGNVVSSLGEHIDLAEVTNASMQTSTSAIEMTDIAGQYSFNNNAMMSSYEISAYKGGDYLNGVSTLDLILVQRHILGLNRFDNAYHTIAADVSGDERVSAIDLVVMRSLLLGRTQSFPGDISWRFVDAQQQYSDVANPWPLKESLQIAPLQNDQLDNDFIGIKLGDINGNAIANSQLLADSRNVKTIELQVSNHQVSKGEMVEVMIDLQEIKDLYGIQLGLSLSNGKWKDIKGTTIDLNEEHVYIYQNNLSLSWSSVSSLTEGGQLVITFEADKNGIVSDFISIAENTLSSQVYFGDDLSQRNVELSYSSIATPELVLHQNVPNPFNESTKISFKIAEEGQVEFSIFDITGRQLYASKGFYEAGSHEMIIDDNIVNQKGILYYQVGFGDKVATKKMISID